MVLTKHNSSVLPIIYTLMPNSHYPKVCLTDPDKGIWVVLEDWMCQGYSIPSGFLTDFATTPRLLWSIFPRYGRYLAAAIVHDYLISHPSYTRYQADRIFLTIMKSYNVSFVTRTFLYLGVRIGSLFG